jgi:nitroreductase
LINARRSVRKWISDPVPQEVVLRAVEHALRSPSACNRQPFSIVALYSKELLQSAAALLKGGGGFAADAPLIAAIVSDYSAYEGHEHRKLPFSDGGMAAMLFILSLTAQGYSTVCMNWAVDTQRDKKMRALLHLDPSEVILFFVGIGKAHPEARIPLSVRKPALSALRIQ